MGYLSTNENMGRTHINISVPDSPKPHWCLEYWNNFNLLKKEEQIFLIKDIRDHRVNSRGKNEFLVQWDGFNLEDNTWEPEKEINRTDQYKLYKEKYIGV